MKSILAILFLFICQFGMGQVPGTPFFFKTGPIVYTYAATSPTSNLDKFDKANISGEIINRGQTIVQTGYIWGTNGTDGVIRLNNSMAWTKDAANAFVTLAVGDVDCGTF
jgi:hypothetical protein